MPDSLPQEAPPTRPMVPPRPALTPTEADAPPTRAVSIFGLVVMLGFVGGFLTWANLAPLAEAAIAPGMIKVEGTRRTLQHLEGGMVREILVRDGDRVTRGQVVLRLDDVQTSATLHALQAMRQALGAHHARLKAELERAATISFPAELLQSSDPRVLDAMTGQRAIFAAREAAMASQLAGLLHRREQARGTIASTEGQLESANRQYALLRQEEAMRRGLVQQGLARLPELLALQRSLAGVEGAVADLNGQVRRALASIDEMESQAQALQEQRLHEAGTEAREVASRIAETEERIRGAADIATRRDLVAPEDGTVLNLRVFNPGAVLRPGDPVMELVPLSDRLVAEVQIQPMDIDTVAIGLPAEVRLPGLNQRTIPVLQGEVSFISADVTTDPQTRISHYRAQIRLDSAQMATLPAVLLTPGMPVEAHVLTGSRTFWRYLTQPLRDSLQRAFREP